MSEQNEQLLVELMQALKNLRLALVEQTRVLSDLTADLDKLVREPPKRMDHPE